MEEIDPIKDRINTIRNSKTIRILALILMYIFAAIAIVFLVYYIKNIEFIKTHPCARCEEIGNTCMALLR